MCYKISTLYNNICVISLLHKISLHYLCGIHILKETLDVSGQFNARIRGPGLFCLGPLIFLHGPGLILVNKANNECRYIHLMILFAHRAISCVAGRLTLSYKYPKHDNNTAISNYFDGTLNRQARVSLTRFETGVIGSRRNKHTWPVRTTVIIYVRTYTSYIINIYVYVRR